MKELEQVYFENRESFRSWLEKYHKESPGIWMIFYKKHTDIVCIVYREALEEAICFGWIDSILRRIDDERYVRKFTPRTNTSNWSDVNRKLVIALIKNGRMTEAGLQKIDVWLRTGKVNWKIKKVNPGSKNKTFFIPEYFLKALSDNEPALENFNKLTQSNKRQYVLWITFAKREETLQKRIKEAVELLKENRLLGLR